MSIKVPNGCKTPKSDREEYRLTSHDLDFMVKRASEIWEMLCYYCNMPENMTGNVYTEGDNLYPKFEKLCTTIEDIKNDLWAMEQR